MPIALRPFRGTVSRPVPKMVLSRWRWTVASASRRCLIIGVGNAYLASRLFPRGASSSARTTGWRSGTCLMTRTSPTLRTTCLTTRVHFDSAPSTPVSSTRCRTRAPHTRVEIKSIALRSCRGAASPPGVMRTSWSGTWPSAECCIRSWRTSSSTASPSCLTGASSLAPEYNPTKIGTRTKKTTTPPILKCGTRTTVDASSRWTGTWEAFKASRPYPTVAWCPRLVFLTTICECGTWPTVVVSRY
mmetsp:Transcript_13684/g.41028  ORF Transcript_13684/g.41028 Transcript_13684/m.41028 type:complete len:245 (+) Transcript_13684:154-888(+)